MGPLNGFRIIELAGIGPGPYCGMLLADLGAEVVAVERPSTAGGANPARISGRGKRSIALDLKSPTGVDALLRLVERADALFEGFRPGVAERLGVGPDECLERNPRLVYGRMTGWGQSGPLAKAAGHDINYIALTGVLHAIGLKKKPLPPLNLVGDFGGGGVFLALGIVCALLETQKSGQGQVVDAAMTDGSASLLSFLYGLAAQGLWRNEREANFLDGGAHFYNVYETKDGKFIALGSIEAPFYRLLIDKAGLDQETFAPQHDAGRWPALRQELERVFKTKTRDEWCALMEGTDVCFAPVLSFTEAPHHPHNRARQTFIDVDGVTQPAPAPRFSRTPGAVRYGPQPVGADTREVLMEWGLSPEEIAALKS